MLSLGPSPLFSLGETSVVIWPVMGSRIQERPELVWQRAMKMIKGLKYLIQGQAERLGEEKAQWILSTCRNIWCREIQIEPNSSHWCPVTRQEAMGTD